MDEQIVSILADAAPRRLFGRPRPVRRYSTFDFGRERDNDCVSVVVPGRQAREIVYAVRKKLPPGLVAFVGTTRWLGDETHRGGAEIVVGRGTSQFDILRLARSDAINFDMETDDLIAKLQEWDRESGIDIFLATTDTIEFALNRLPGDFPAFARDVYEFCPDIVDQGWGTLEKLQEIIQRDGYVSLWWD